MLGHAAVVVPDHAEAKQRLRDAGFEVEDTPAAVGSRPRLRDRPRRPPRRADGRRRRPPLRVERASGRPRIGPDAREGRRLLADLHLGDHPLDHVGWAALCLSAMKQKKAYVPGLELGRHHLDLPPSITVDSTAFPVLDSPRTGAGRRPALGSSGTPLPARSWRPSFSLAARKWCHVPPSFSSSSVLLTGLQALAAEAVLHGGDRAVGLGQLGSLVAGDRELRQRGRGCRRRAGQHVIGARLEVQGGRAGLALLGGAGATSAWNQSATGLPGPRC